MISLYVKTHNKTGLKYFGKTKRKNVHNYIGSGVYWKRHLKKHGRDYTTDIIAQFSEDQVDALKDFAINFSIENNIVKSNEWANFTIETGLDGNSFPKEKHPMWGKKGKNHQRYGKPLSEESRQRMSKAQKGRIITQEAREKIRQKLLGTRHSEETRAKMSKSLKGKTKGEKNGNYGKSWFTNGIDNIMTFEAPEGYHKGRTISKSK
jgi:hypothetical protein